MQSLILALSMAGIFLGGSVAGKQGRLRWLGMTDLGFPPPPVVPVGDNAKEPNG